MHRLIQNVVMSHRDYITLPGVQGQGSFKVNDKVVWLCYTFHPQFLKFSLKEVVWREVVKGKTVDYKTTFESALHLLSAKCGPDVVVIRSLDLPKKQIYWKLVLASFMYR